MRRALLAALAWALAPEAAAQTPDSTASGPVATVDTVRVDTVSGRAVRFAFPTEGGVFYYRAGRSTARRQPRTADRALPARSALDARPEAAPVAVRDTIVIRDGVPVRDRVVAREPQNRRESPASGLTQRDLDRLEDRLLDALDRRLAERDRRRPAPARPAPEAVVVPVPVPPRAERPDEAVPFQPVPIPPVAAPPVRPDGVTIEQIERDILDTGLFRTTAVHFEFARAELLPISRRTLDALADVLRRYPALRIEVGGHTDAMGSDATNDALSARRAASVTSYLAVSGVEAERLSAVGYGERRPVASNDTETGRALNRRVDFVVVAPEAGRAPR